MREHKQGTIKDWLIVLAALLDDIAVLALVLLVLWFFKIEITLPIVIVLALLFLAFVPLMHRAIIPSLHRKKVTGAEGMIGLEGRVVQPLTPVGVIKVGSEYWRAQSVGEDIAADEEVEVLGISHLTLRVRRKGK